MAKYKYKMNLLSGPLMTSGAGSSKSGTIIVDCSQEQWVSALVMATCLFSVLIYGK